METGEAMPHDVKYIYSALLMKKRYLIALADVFFDYTMSGKRLQKPPPHFAIKGIRFPGVGSSLTKVMILQKKITHLCHFL